MKKYKLDSNGSPVPCPNLFEWAEWFETAQRQVKHDTFGEIRVSTVFLGIDHNWREDGPPILWETMVFGGPMNEEQHRCAGGIEQAEAMHAEMVGRLRAVLALNEP